MGRVGGRASEFLIDCRHDARRGDEIRAAQLQFDVTLRRHRWRQFLDDGPVGDPPRRGVIEPLGIATLSRDEPPGNHRTLPNSEHVPIRGFQGR